MLKNKIKYMLLLAFSFLLACGEDKQSIKPIDTSSLDLKESLSLISTPVNSSWLLAINTSVNNEKITWLLHESGYLWFWSLTGNQEPKKIEINNIIDVKKVIIDNIENLVFLTKEGNVYLINVAEKRASIILSDKSVSQITEDALLKKDGFIYPWKNFFVRVDSKSTFLKMIDVARVKYFYNNKYFIGLDAGGLSYLVTYNDLSLSDVIVMPLGRYGDIKKAIYTDNYLYIYANNKISVLKDSVITKTYDVPNLIDWRADETNDNYIISFVTKESNIMMINQKESNIGLVDGCVSVVNMLKNGTLLLKSGLIQSYKIINGVPSCQNNENTRKYMDFLVDDVDVDVFVTVDGGLLANIKNDINPIMVTTKNPIILPILKMQGLVAFWDFIEPSNEDRLDKGAEGFRLLEANGTVKRVKGGAFSGFSALFEGGNFFNIPYSKLGKLDINGKKAQLTMFAVVKLQEMSSTGTTIAGVWSEGKGIYDDSGTRQYLMMLNVKAYGGAKHLTPHISSEGGVTRRNDGSVLPWCVDYAAGKTKIPINQWVTLGFTYDGEYIRAYYNGMLDERLPNPAADNRQDRYFTREGPSGGNRGMNPYYHGRGIFKYDVIRHAKHKPNGGSDFSVGARQALGHAVAEPLHGEMSGLMVFNRALSSDELKALHDFSKETQPN